MNKWSKLGLTVGMGAAVITGTHMINKFIFRSSTSRRVTDTDFRKKYHWKFGDISYTVNGEGSPLLLIHDLSCTSSSYEWTKLIGTLSQNHRLYTIDLLGCGYSDKPNFTYTTYMYTQLINDFIINVISKKTSVIVTGNSVPLTIMTAYSNPLLFDKIIMINPQSIKDAMQIPTKRSKCRRKLVNMPVFGTLLYNICMSRKEIKNDMIRHLFKNPSEVSSQILDAYHESAHLYGPDARYLFSSTQCHYTTASISKALSQLDNSLYLIYGQNEANIKNTIAEYTTLNPAIETACITNTKHLPQIEKPHQLLYTLKLFLTV